MLWHATNDGATLRAVATLMMKVYCKVASSKC